MVVVHLEWLQRGDVNGIEQSRVKTQNGDTKHDVVIYRDGEVYSM